MKRILYLTILFILPSILSFGQTTIYVQDFGNGTALPTGWTKNGAFITSSSANPSSGYANASAVGNLLFSNTTNTYQEIITSAISTVGYTSINISLGGFSTLSPGAFPGLSIDYSIDGGLTWNTTNYPDISNFDDTWYPVSYNLPTDAEGVTSMKFRLSFVGDNSSDGYRLDDFTVSGTGGGAATYYSTSSNINFLASWNTKTDGTGVAPTSFTSDNQTFVVQNNATIAGDWTISGSNSKVVINGGANFTIPANFALFGTVDVSANATLTINNTTIPTFGTLASLSKVVYSGSTTQTITATTYSILTTSGATQQLGGSVTVDDTLIVNSRLNLLNSNTLTINGYFTGTSRSLGGAITSNIIVNGSGTISPIFNFAAGARNLGTFTLNRSGGEIALGTALTINTQLVLSQGNFALNNQTLTLNNANIVATSGRIKGSTASSITLTGSGSGGTLVMQQASSATRSLNTLTINRSLNLGSNLEMVGQLKLDAGTLTVGANTLTLNGANTSITSGVFSTSASSSLVLGGTNLSVSIPSSVLALNNLTINNVNGVSLNSSITVNGALNLLAGTLAVGTNTLTLLSSVAVTSGTFSSGATGIVEYKQATNGQSIVAGSYGGLTLNGFNKVFPTGTISISGTFNPGTATNHTIAGSTINYNSSGAQSIAAFNYNNLTISGSARSITLPTASTVGIAGTFTQGSNTFSASTSTVDFNGTGAQTIPSAMSYYNLSVSKGGIKTMGNNLVVANNVSIGASTTLSTSSSNFDVSVGGNWTNAGTFTAGTGTVTFNGIGTQVISGASNSNFYKIAKTTATALTLSSAQNLTKLLTLTSGATFNSNGFLKLLSTASETAKIANLTGVTFNGNITMQRYIRGGARSYRFISSPIQSFTLGQLQDNIFIIGPDGNGFDVSTSKNYSAHTLNTLTNAWVGIPAISTSISPGTGFRVFFMGDRTQTTAVNDKNVIPLPVTLDFVGAINKGTITLPTTDAGTSRWNLVGNPYPCTIDWDAAGWTKTNIDNTVYVWKPADNNTGSYATYKDGVGLNGGSRYIASSQGFMVHVGAAGTSTLTITEAVKVTNDAQEQDPTVGYYRVSSEENKLRIKLTEAKGSSDEALIRFIHGATRGFDNEFDAIKLNNPGEGNGLSGTNISSYGGTSSLAINTMPDLIKSEIIPLNVVLSSSGNHQLEFTGVETFAGKNIVLYDAFTKVSTNLSDRSVYSFSTSQLDSTSFGSKRFQIVFNANIITGLRPSVVVFPNPNQGEFKLRIQNPDSKEVSWKAYDVTGRVIAEKRYTTSSNGLEEDIHLEAQKGVYFLKVQVGEEVINKKIVLQ